MIAKLIHQLKTNKDKQENEYKVVQREKVKIKSRKRNQMGTKLLQIT